jgi:hypothetical protein
MPTCTQLVQSNQHLLLLPVSSTNTTPETAVSPPAQAHYQVTVVTCHTDHGRWLLLPGSGHRCLQAPSFGLEMCVAAPLMLDCWKDLEPAGGHDQQHSYDSQLLVHGWVTKPC